LTVRNTELGRWGGKGGRWNWVRVSSDDTRRVGAEFVAVDLETTGRSCEDGAGCKNQDVVDGNHIDWLDVL
jgi:hypothetical protein